MSDCISINNGALYYYPFYQFIQYLFIYFTIIFMYLCLVIQNQKKLRLNFHKKKFKKSLFNYKPLEKIILLMNCLPSPF